MSYPWIAGLDSSSGGFYKRMLPAVARNLSLSLSLSLSLPSFCWKVTKVPIYQVQSFEERRRGDSGSVRGSGARFKGVARQQ